MTNKLVRALFAGYLYVKSCFGGNAPQAVPVKYRNPNYVLNLLLMRLKSAILVSLFFFASISIAQANNLPIPVAANESITVTLFFPSEIKKVIKPAVNYKFDYEQYGTMGTLVARKGASSNLTVITEDGSIFSFLLQYDQEVANFTYVLSAEQAIGRMEPTGSTRTISAIEDKEANSLPENEPQVSSQNEQLPQRRVDDKPVNKQEFEEREPTVRMMHSDLQSQNRMASDNSEKEEQEALAIELAENNLYDTDREGYYTIFCENNYNQEPRLKKGFKAGDGVELQLNSLMADKNEFYFIFQVTNRLSSQFKAEALKFYVRTAPEDKPLHMTPVHVFKQQETIEAGRTKKMVYVLNNFRLSKDQKVFVVLNEKDGPRNTIIKIDSRTINSVGEKSKVSAR
ncbi:conjugative transposon protein TraN [Maribacter sp.]|nr:conjugative transposon protein TraN [Maribacter sp.]